ncbi:hypothetical protein [Ancylobacter terrae]|uniref:hypothetical protein n=1 Tax=Ancylobacter sp. sgz301288 TaxID=3342077 RepID=UPI00385C5DB8
MITPANRPARAARGISMPGAATLGAAALALLLYAAPGPAQAADATGLWPCIQPKVASLAAAQMWAGDPVEGLTWRDDPQVADLVPVLAARRTPIDSATTMIDDFAKQAGAGRNKRLTLLFAGVFDQINTQRSRILSGIERYAQHQVDLSKRIRQDSLDLATAKKDTSDAGKAKAVELEKQLLWDTRIYDTRTQAVTAVCESPVILEQRAFALARAIQNAME